MAINDIVQTIAEARVDARSLSEFVFKPSGFKVTRRLAPTIDTLQFYVNSLSLAVTEAQGKVAYIETTVQDAINNTAVEGGVLADTFVTMTKKGEGTVARNLREVNADIYDLRDFGISADGADKTSDIVSLMQSLSTSERRVINTDHKTRFNAEAVLQSMPTGTAINLNGTRIGNFSGGYKQSYYGVLANDVEVDDSYHVVETGHNPSTALINHRTSGSASALNGAATNAYCLGRTENGSPRIMGVQQWGKTASNTWGWSIRATAPWRSVADVNNMYFYWISGTTVSAGDYRIHNNITYKATTSGVAGAAPPVHREGVVSDGGVDWQFEMLGDATIFQIDEMGNFAINSAATQAKQVVFSQSVNDSSSIYSVSIEPKGESKRSIFSLGATSAAGLALQVPRFISTLEGSIDLLAGGQTSASMSIYPDRLRVSAFASLSKTVPNGTTTPSVSFAGMLIINNLSATTITNLLDGVADQVVQLFFTNANTTLKDGLFVLQGRIDVTPTAFSIITVRKIGSGSITGAWVEVSRSIK